MSQHADALDRETQLLVENGYFDADGNPRTDQRGKEIWNCVQAQLEAERSKGRRVQ